MYAVKSSLKKAESVKQYLIDNDLFDKHRNIKKENGFIFFPVIDRAKVKDTLEVVCVKLDEIKEKKTLKQQVQEKLDKNADIKTAFDILGDIAIIEVDDVAIEKLLADFILKTHKNIKTVVKKAGIHDGTFRTQDVKFIAGEKKTIAIHKENNVRLKLDVGKVYFSPRLSTERKRILEQICPGEKILVMFSGCGPYPIVFAKNTKAKKIIGVEINPKGHEYAEENVKLNKIKNVELYNEDVKNIVPSLGKFDRILMPLPKSAEDFLDIALQAAMKGTIIHFYDFLHKDKFKEAHDKIESACKINHMPYRIISTNKCGQHAPYVYRICVDFRIT